MHGTTFAPDEARLGDVAEQGGPPACASYATASRQVQQELTDVGLPGPLGGPRVCLLYYPAEDVYLAKVIGIGSMTHFRAVKAAAVARLAGAGFDPCMIAVWDWWGRFDRTEIRADDELGLPVECRPRVDAGDDGARAWLDSVRDALTGVVDLTGAQMGVRPTRPLRVMVFSDARAMAGFCRTYRTGDNAARCAEAAQDGRSSNTTLLQPFGGLIQINLSQGERQFIPSFVAHEYTHFAQGVIGGAASFFPMWFLEGQGEYQEQRNGIPRNDMLGFARRTQNDGVALALGDLSRYDDWVAHERDDGQAAVYSRGYAAVSWLTERFGFAATVQLLRDNADGNLEGFNRVLGSLTGTDLDGVNGAVGDWLTGLPWYVARGDDGSIRLEYTLVEGGTRAEGTLFTDREIPCLDGRGVLRRDLAQLFRVTLAPDGTFAGTMAFGAGLVSIDGALLNGGRMRGSFRYARAGGCDTGSRPLAAGVALVAGTPPATAATAAALQAGGAAPLTTGLTASPATTAAASPSTGRPVPSSVPANARFSGGDDRGYITVEIETDATGTRLDGTLKTVREIPCGGGTVVRAGLTYTFSLDILPDGSFSGATAGAAAVALDGRVVAAGEVRGAYRYHNPDSGCDTGRITFAAR